MTDATTIVSVSLSILLVSSGEDGVGKVCLENSESISMYKQYIKILRTITVDTANTCILAMVLPLGDRILQKILQ